ncbi:methylglyoxal reductase (NADPH-dependent) gre2 [Tulasnella sp. 418]|nr:methylglyoxal reductase (NADPH-dependent) gre2 [Tulasnella sp. 418]
MPALKPPAKILVTGASGYIAVWVAKSLLQRGFTVRGTVRSKGKGEYLRNALSEFGDKFEYVIVEDIAKSGAFDEAVKDVDGVAHTASPVTSNADDPDELIIPAVHGTLSVLESIRENGDRVKRVVVTSSFASVLEPHTSPYTYTELDWNDFAIKEVKEKGRDADPMIKYRASKVMAERAAWDFVKEHQSEIGFDLVTLLPTFVFGPLLHEVNSPDSINISVGLLRSAVIQPHEGGALTDPRGNYVDVRDVADAHVQAILQEKAGGERFLVGVAPYCWQDVYDELNASQIEFGIPIPKGNPGSGVGIVHPAIVDSTKIQEQLGIKVRGTVRSNGKGEYLRGIYSEYDGKFEYVIVEDMVKSGAFDEAVKGIDGIAHTASPVSLTADEPNELIIPALHGTLSILESAKKYGSDVKRVVVTSSLAAALEPHPHPYVYTEVDWCDYALKEVEEKGREATPMMKYRASKVMAERAAWNFVKEHVAEIGFDLVTVLPTFVFGPLLHEVSSPEALNTSAALLHSAITKPQEGSALTTQIGNYVDVRDVAEAHAQALFQEKAGGERFIVGVAPYCWQDVYDQLNESQIDFGIPIPKGSPGAGVGLVHPAAANSAKIQQQLGIKFRPLKESVCDMIINMREQKLL